MTLNDIQARILRQKSLLPPEILERAYQHCVGQPQKDLLELLVEQGLFNQEIADSVRQESFREMRAELSAEIGRFLVKDRWFKPHADHIWQKLELLGEGGMGAVYRVKDQCLDRYGALKIVLGHDQKALARFMREVKMTARLDHPAIPPVYDAGITGNGQYYMVMKVIEGQTLKDRIAEIYNDGSPSRSEIRDLLQVLVRVGEALSYAHSQGILHRDLKPENIMIGRFGEVLVLDWGIAKDLHGDSPSDEEDLGIQWTLPELELQEKGLTVTGSLVGTPGYMAPEQIEGTSSQRSDLFSLGLILSEILTGTKAIPGESIVERVRATLSGSFILPRDVESKVPRALDFLSRKALSLAPEDRFETVEDLCSELKRYLDDQALETYQYSTIERLSRWSSRNPSKLMAMTLGSLLVSLLFFSLYTLEQSERERTRALAQADEASLREDQAQRAARLAREREQQTKDVFFQLQQLEQWIERGRPKSQIMAKLDTILEGQAPNSAFLLLAAKLCRLLKDDERENQLLNECVESFPPAYEALFILHKKKTSEVYFLTAPLKKLAKRARERGDVNEFTICVTALEHFDKGEHKEALSGLAKLEQYSSKFLFGYCLRGAVRGQLGQYDEAVADFNYVLRSDPDNIQALYNRAYTYHVMGESKRAVPEFDAIIERKPMNVTFLSRRAEARFEIDDRAGSLADINRALALDPQFGYGYYHRGVLTELAGDVEGALRDFRKSVQLKVRPFDFYKYRANSHASIAKILLKRRKREEAEESLKACFKIDPDNLKGLFQQVLVNISKSQWKEALAGCNRILKAQPTNSGAYFNRGVAKQNLGQLNEAIEDYGRAIRLKADDYKIYHNRGMAYYQLKKWTAAEADFSLALEKIPNYFLGYNFRGYTRLRLKKYRLAALDFEEYLKRQPRDSKASELRQFIQKTLGRASRY